MSDENMLDQVELEEDQNLAEDEQPQKKEKRTFTDEDVQTIVTRRLSKTKQELEEARQQKAELEARLKAMSGTPSQGVQAPAGMQNYSPEEFNAMEEIKKFEEEAMARGKQQAAFELKFQDFRNTIEEAAEEDDEFKQLLNNAGNNELAPDTIMDLMNINNPAAVIKHLLKDKDDYMVYLATLDEPRSAQLKFLQKMSKDLKKQTRDPAPSPYQPVPDVKTAEDSAGGWDLESYIKGKY